jgi:hypothetical protein
MIRNQDPNLLLKASKIARRRFPRGIRTSSNQIMFKLLKKKISF